MPTDWNDYTRVPDELRHIWQEDQARRMAERTEQERQSARQMEIIEEAARRATQNEAPWTVEQEENGNIWIEEARREEIEAPPPAERRPTREERRMVTKTLIKEALRELLEEDMMAEGFMSWLIRRKRGVN